MTPAAPPFTRTCHSVALELSAAPFLPGIAEEPAPTPTVDDEHQVAPRPEYTGRILLRDEERCLRVGAMRLMGYSDRAIARELGMSHHSVSLIVEALEAQGKLEPLRARLLAHVGRLAEQAALASRDLLGRLVECPSSDLAAAVRAATNTLDVAAEKHALLTGQPTNISAVVQSGPSREEWDRWVQAEVIEVESEPVGQAAPESESGAKPSTTSEIESSGAGDTVAATPTTADSGQVEPATGAAETEAGGPAAPPRGGAASGRGPRDDR